MRATQHGIKQVQVRWEGYARCTWEPYESIRQQLPDMVAMLEASLASNSEAQADAVRCFVDRYIAAHHIDAAYRWGPNRLVALEHAAIAHTPRIKLMVDHLQKIIMQLVSAVPQ